jgi:hypothetical protein
LNGLQESRVVCKNFGDTVVCENIRQFVRTYDSLKTHSNAKNPNDSQFDSLEEFGLVLKYNEFEKESKEDSEH